MREELVLKAIGGVDGLRAIMDGADLTDRQIDDLCDVYADEMPVGIQKARTGDPGEWLFDRLTAIAEDLGMRG